MNLSYKTTFGNLPKDKYLVTILPRLKEEKTRQFLTLVMTLIAIIGFSLLAINPTLGTITELNKELDDSKFVETHLQQKIAALSQLQKQYNAIQADLPTLFNAIPSNPEIPLFVAQIQGLAQNNNIDLQRVQTFPIEIPQTVLPASSYLSFAFSVDATGSQSNILAFINNLDAFSRLISIDGISFVKTESKLSPIRINIKGKSYFKTL